MTKYAMTLALMASMGLAIGCEKHEAGGADEPGPPPPGDDAGSSEAAPGEEESGGDVDDAAEAGQEMVDEAKRQAEDAAEEAAKEAEERAAEVTEEARSAMRGYLSQLEALAEKLAGMEGGLGDFAGAPQVKSLVDDVRSRIEQLNALDPAVLDRLKSEFSDRLASATSAARAQFERIRESDQLSSIAELIEGVELID